MPATYKWYGTDAEVAVPVVEDRDLHVIRFAPGTDYLRGIDSATKSSLDEVSESRLYLRGAGVLMLRHRDTDGVSAAALGPLIDDILGVGAEDSLVSFSETGLRFKESGKETHTTGRLYIRFLSSMGRGAAERALRALRSEGKITSWDARNRPGRLVFQLVARDVSVDGLFTLASALHGRSDVEQCYPYLGIRTSLAGPCAREWHLRRAGTHWPGYASSSQPDAVSSGLEAVAAWRHAEGFRSMGCWLGWRSWFWPTRIVVAVLDVGIDVDHDAFSGVGKVVSPANTVGTGDPEDPRPQTEFEVHGTAMAGLAVARGGRGAHGVAPAAALMPVRIMEALESESEVDIDESAAARGFDHARENGADVISCSWLWTGSALPTGLQEAIHAAAESGRDGKGCAVLFASGNRGVKGLESINDNPTASHPEVIAVGACHPALEHSGNPSEVSTVTVFGSALWCLFPVGGGTTYPPMYLVGRSGVTVGNTDASSEHVHSEDPTASTSKACAGAAGVAALILSASYELGATDVKRIMAECCEKITTSPGPATSALTLSPYGADGRSDSHGHGRLNALRAVEISKGLCSTATNPA